MEPRHLVAYKNGGAVSPLTAASGNKGVLVHHDGAHGVTRPTTVGGW